MQCATSIKERALVYLQYKNRRYYSTFLLLGLVVSGLSFSSAEASFASLVAVIAGFVAAYLDGYTYKKFLIKNVELFAKRLDWLEFFLLKFGLRDGASTLSWWSVDSFKLYLWQITFFIKYEFYKWTILIFIFLLIFFVADKPENIIFNWGLSILFFAAFYIFLWNKFFIKGVLQVFNVSPGRYSYIINEYSNK